MKRLSLPASRSASRFLPYVLIFWRSRRRFEACSRDMISRVVACTCATHIPLATADWPSHPGRQMSRSVSTAGQFRRLCAIVRSIELSDRPRFAKRHSVNSLRNALLAFAMGWDHPSFFRRVPPTLGLVFVHSWSAA